jgi:hypothetical protein
MSVVNTNQKCTGTKNGDVFEGNIATGSHRLCARAIWVYLLRYRSLIRPTTDLLQAWQLFNPTSDLHLHTYTYLSCRCVDRIGGCQLQQFVTVCLFVTGASLCRCLNARGRSFRPAGGRWGTSSLLGLAHLHWHTQE